MALTRSLSNVSVTTGTSLVLTSATFPGGTPLVGDLVVVVIQRDLESAITAPAGWEFGGAVVSSAATISSIGWYYRVWTGTEATTYTWTWTGSTTVRWGAVTWHESVAGRTWVLDKVGTDPGSGTPVISRLIGTTGTLSSADSVAIAAIGYIVPQADITWPGAWSELFGGSNFYALATLIPGATTSLAPTVTPSVGAVIACSGIVTFYSQSPSVAALQMVI